MGHNHSKGRSTKNHVHTKVDVPLYKTTNINHKNKSHEKNFISASNQHSVFNDTEKETNSSSKPRPIRTSKKRTSANHTQPITNQPFWIDPESTNQNKRSHT